jgi:hypothetical protein
MNTKIGFIGVKYAVRDGLVAYNNRKLNKQEWRKNIKMANSNCRLRLARERAQGLERSYALTDINRKVVVKKMMTCDEAYQRNRTTRQFGMFWVLCG